MRHHSLLGKKQQPSSQSLLTTFIAGVDVEFTSSAIVVLVVLVMIGSVRPFDPARSFLLSETTTPTAMIAAVVTETNPSIITLYF
jgi:hypothetical protein